MRVFVTGASGWTGRHVLPELINAGHRVVGLARSEASAARIAAQGAEVLRGSLTDLDTLRAGATAADGVIHLAFVHDDMDHLEQAMATDARAVEALGAALEGTGKPLVSTYGPPMIPGHTTTERDWSAPGLVVGRETTSRAALALAERGVRTIAMRLPRSVHGVGDQGFITILAGIARARGIAGYVDDGAARWPAVHVKDAAVLYRLAVERAPAGTVLHAIGDEGVAVRDIAAAIGRGLGLPTGPVPPETLGFLGMLATIDHPAAAPHTRDLLDWKPVHPGLIEDIDQGHYFQP
jgi:nucleoside-diphosphate-sugar epimerase